MASIKLPSKNTDLIPLTAFQFSMPLTLTDTLLSIDYFERQDLPYVLKNEQSAGAYPWRETDFLSSLASSHHCLGLKKQNDWVGHCVVSLAAGEAELLILAIGQKFQCQGLASVFLNSLMQVFSSKAEQFFLEVRQSNLAAIALYEKLGFNCVGERLNYYPIEAKKSRENALIYAAELELFRM